MEIKKGIPVSPGVVIADAFVLDVEDYRILRKAVDDDEISAELGRLDRAFEASLQELINLRDKTTSELGRDAGAIFDFHVGVLKHEQLRQQVRQAIQQRKYSAAYAVTFVLHTYQRRFHQFKDQLLAERVRDFQDIEKRLLRNILGESREELSGLTTSVVLVAHDLTPSQTADLDTATVVGLATDIGGLTSHTSILSRSLGLPAVTGLKDASLAVAGGDTVIIDGTNGLLIINPDSAALKEYREQQQRHIAFAQGLVELADKPSVTADGVRVHLLGNIEFPPEAATCIEKGADGIGLYRTEFLYLGSETEPTEETHYKAYRSVVEKMGDRPVTIRTLDLGADKWTQGQRAESERNPFLGLRSLRYCLQHSDLFKVQLRAMLRASVGAQVQIMFPLVTSLMELRQAKTVLGHAVEDLEEEGIPFKEDLKVGVMIETPAAAVQIKEFLREVEFVSIGTNDLVQYLLAVDRANERVAHLFTASHPAVLRMLRNVIRASDRAGIECSLCGEMAGEPIYTLFLLGLGLRRFSMAPNDVPEIKKLIRSTSITHAERITKRALTFETDRQVTNYLRAETRKILPEAL